MTTTRPRRTEIHTAPTGDGHYAAGAFSPAEPGLYVVELGRTPQAARARLIETFEMLAERVEVVKQGS